MFFWIIVLSFLIPMAMRYYKKSVRGRNQNQGMPGGPDQFGQFPGDPSGGGAGRYPGQHSNQPRDGFTQRDYYGGFGQLGAPQPPATPQPPVPYEDSPEYLNNPPQAWRPPAAQQQPPAPAPEAPAPPSAPQGFRARKLAELDQRYSEGELSMEDYMAQRAEIMKG
ncbi:MULTISPECIES: hypothetical protein [unclassified Arthrobacter]|uniref:hypothetical protein n=1 Tax=unclassified Arthrobacter TaxID=235627 RepID=UPI002E13464E|nr:MULTISPECIES: hypothetical protein [unclassified Arthrobacter]